MTTRRFNYTGCQRIARADVQVALSDAGIPPVASYAHDLTEYEFPGSARVVMEAQAHWTFMRFDCGTVAVPESSNKLVLSDFAAAEGIGFRLKVVGVGKQEGLILGEADGIRPATPKDDQDAESLLAVQPAELGDVAWHLSFAGAEPLLQVNKRLGDWRSFMRRPEVLALVIPEVYRQLLREALTNAADADAADAWQNVLLAGVGPAVGSRPSVADDDAVDGWVNEAVAVFAARHRLLRDLLSSLGDSQ